MSKKDELLRELPYWYKTGIQDFLNAGDIDALVDDAKVKKSDSYEQMHKKITKLLLEDVSIDTHSELADDDRWTRSEKQKLLEEWVDGWASKAASYCSNYFKAKKEEEEY